MAKKLVRGDYKSGRVKDPTAKLSTRHEKSIKNFVKEFMDKAVKKKEERDKLKANGGGEGSTPKDPRSTTPTGDIDMEEVKWEDDIKNGEASHDASPADSTSELKRKRHQDDEPNSPKKSRTEHADVPAPPPPPPPPPAGESVEEYGHDLDMSESIVYCSNGRVEETKDYGHPKLMQLATPSTNGSGVGHGEQEGPDR